MASGNDIWLEGTGEKVILPPPNVTLGKDHAEKGRKILILDFCKFFQKENK